MNRYLIVVLYICIYSSVFGQNSNRVRSIAERMKAKEAEIVVPVGRYSMTMHYIARGSFMMGRDGYIDEKPKHLETVDDLYFSKYEVTVGEFLEFCKETNSNWPSWLEVGNHGHVETGDNSLYKDMGYSREGAERLPIVGVTWYNALRYAEWLSRKTGVKYRLPTEAEWEFASRGGQSYEFAGSDIVNEVCWCFNNSGNKPQEVGRLRANGYGLYDMSGNVWEWTADCLEVNSSKRVYRGGSWISEEQYCRVSSRLSFHPDDRENSIGFRLVASIIAKR